MDSAPKQYYNTLDSIDSAPKLLDKKRKLFVEDKASKIENIYIVSHGIIEKEVKISPVLGTTVPYLEKMRNAIFFEKICYIWRKYVDFEKIWYIWRK